MGRHKADIDADQVVNLAKLGATVREIAEFFHVSDTCINNRFLKEVEEGRSLLKQHLRRAQLHVALEDKNPTMLIWLGKQYLGQSDTQNLNITDKKVTAEDGEKILDGLLGKLGK